MKCKLMGQSLRVFSRAVRLFSKLSTEVLIIADNNKMKLQSLNDYKTAFLEIQFESRFFSSYECVGETKCKLFMKSLILVFRVLNINKVCNSCTLIMDESNPKIIFEMQCRSGVNREYFLPYMESNELRNSTDLNEINPTFRAEAKLMFECLQNFSNETKDISLWLSFEQILFKSYFDLGEEQNIMTSFAYKSREFQNYNINNEISVTFNLKDLKNFVEFSSFNDQNIDSYFEASGRPIHFVVKTNAYYSAKLMLATHDFPEDAFPIPPSFPNSNTQNQSSMSSGNLSLNISVQNSLQSINSSARNPECILNTSAFNNENSFPNNSNNNNNNLSDFSDEDRFPDDDNIIEDILSQMPQFSGDNNEDSIQVAEEVQELSQNALNMFHRSVLLGSDDEDNVVPSSQDILVPESDEEQ